MKKIGAFLLALLLALSLCSCGGKADAPEARGSAEITNLFDGDPLTKWIVPMGEDVIRIRWQVEESVAVERCTLVACEDSAQNTGRNPVQWQLLGQIEGTNQLEVVHFEGKGGALKDTYLHEYTVSVKPTGHRYSAFEWLILSNGGADQVQLSEFLINDQRTIRYPVPAVTVAEASPGVESTMEAANLFDGNADTKWQASLEGGPVYVEWSVEEPTEVKSYTMVTANDCTSGLSEYNPARWTLAGRRDGQAEWETIHRVERNETLINVDSVAFSFEVEPTGRKYSDFRLTIDRIGNDRMHHDYGEAKLSEFILNDQWQVRNLNTEATVNGCTITDQPDRENTIDGKVTNLFDGDATTGWRLKEIGLPHVIEWFLDEPISVESYTIVLGSDQSQYPGSKPRGWALMAWNTQNEDYGRLAVVKEDAVLVDTDSGAFTFSVEPTGQKYDRFILSLYGSSGADFVQLSEFIINDSWTVPNAIYYGPDNPPPTPTPVQTKAPSGGDGGNDSGGSGINGHYEWQTKEVDCPSCSFGNCSTCGGKGYYSFAGEKVSCDPDCSACDGKGKIEQREYVWVNDWP